VYDDQLHTLTAALGERIGRARPALGRALSANRGSGGRFFSPMDGMEKALSFDRVPRGTYTWRVFVVLGVIGSRTETTLPSRAESP
jgi:hypothetical protein